MGLQLPVQGAGCLNEAQVIEGFLAAPPLISQTIADLTITHPEWLVDLAPTSPFPLGNGTVMQHLIFRGEMPEIERGWGKWAALQNNQGCDPCFGPGCGYNMSAIGGYGLERKETALMKRELRTPDYCVSQIQYTYQFEEVMAQIVKNLWRQVSFFKAYNINFNALTGMAKKFVVDSEGAKANTANPYVYPNIGTARLSNLNIELLSFFYEWLRISPDTIPYNVQDGRPQYALMASDELLSRLYRDDPTLRQDVRFSGWANDNLLKYNFLTTIRGMYIPAPIQFPRRFNIVDGEPIEVLPFLKGIPMEIGTFTGINPAYQAATHEEVLLHGRNPFQIFIGQQAETLGQNTSFGPEPTYLDWFMWVNPQTHEDPARRVGYFFNAIQIGIHQQFSDGVFGVLVERPSRGLMFQQNPIPVCPVANPDCDNTIPDTGCPCPPVLSVTPNPVVAGQFFVELGVPTDAAPASTIQFQLASGGFIIGTVVAQSTDDRFVSVTFNNAPNLPCNDVTNIFCVDTLVCSSLVLSATDCRSDQTGNVSLILSEPIKAVTAADVITAYFCDGTTADLDVVSANLVTNEWVVNYAAGFGPTDDPTGAGATVLAADLICDRGGIYRVCVPPATDATCPVCDIDVTTQCVPPIL